VGETKGTTHILHWSVRGGDATKGNQRLGCAQAVESISLAMALLAELMGGAAHTATVARLGEALWDPLADHVAANWLHPYVPSKPADVEVFRQQAALAGSLEEAARRLGLTAGTVLSRAAAAIELQYAQERRRLTVGAARDAMLLPLHDVVNVSQAAEALSNEASERCTANAMPQASTATVEALGAADEVGGLEESHRGVVMRQPRCQVSRAAHEVAGLGVRALEEAVYTGGCVAAQLVFAVMETCDLYRALIPVQHLQTLQAAPQLRMILRNDLHYLALELLRLQLVFGKTLEAELRAPVPLAGLAPGLAASARAEEAAALAMQEAAILEVLDGAGGLEGLADEERLGNAHKAVQQALHSVRCAASAWRNMLPEDARRHNLICLMQCIGRRLLSDVLSLEDIEEEETVHLQQLLHAALETDALAEDEPGAATAGEEAEATGGEHPGDLSAEVLQAVPCWLQLQELARMLDTPMKEITQRWVEGLLPGLGFEAQQVQHLICAVFAPSSLRVDCLAQIV
ncbi:hypothetical protein CYMTET_29968, partial [Cymbomonas tetramitiformis]